MIYTDKFQKLMDNLSNGKINKKEVVNILLTLLEESDKLLERIESLKTIYYLKINGDKVFRIIENHLISDESAQIRCLSAKIIFQNFPKSKNFLLLRWVSQYERSALVIKTLLDLFRSVVDPHFKIFQNIILERLKKIYNIPMKEINLFLNLEVLCVEKTKQYNLNIGENWHKIIRMLKFSPDSVWLVQRLYYIKYGGKMLGPLPDDSLPYLKQLI
ncbi:MAG: hypothetical protein GF383_01490 [Candidatus Lokiarchaeota archaeon]|nr:hypothetical protein [Candidatus Lokiarchaeota archaeon]MBD3337937.1 hypothetical protein [Candidatus Lokiarchaeota archaeon]